MLIKAIINAMKDAKIYRKDIDSTFVSMSLIGMIIGPIALPIAAKVLQSVSRSMTGIGRPIFL
jgi:hypothetical protein